ncbi:MAG TPA: glycoside hydrolase family 15 protein [Bryobacteraceae bacterium]|nr:glycoside hydrolase family 15 protein [Bryobacteraceae bacterium]
MSEREPSSDHTASTTAPYDYQPIANYGVIGDMHTAVLISADGSIDWACLPHFDNPAMFLRLLDRRKGGYCAVHADSIVGQSRQYLEATNILETTFVTRSGRMVLIDFMPVRHGERPGASGPSLISDHRIVRLIRCVAGRVDFTVDVKPTFGFAAETVKPASAGPGIVVFEGCNDTLHVQCSQIAVQDDGRAAAWIRLSAGEQMCMVLSSGRSGGREDGLGLDGALEALTQTRRFWTDWSGRFQYEGEYREEILRSILVLKLLTFEPTGAIVAAPTTSLPELVGGSRNWDYRFSWLRDSQFAMTALMHCGYIDEAHDFLHFLQDASKGLVDHLHILYGIRGEHVRSERLLTHLEGYRRSTPVRVGNAAATQKQSDVYGELLNCMSVYAYSTDSKTEEKARASEVWPLASALAGWVTRHWQEPDHGIWESRREPLHFVHSKAMCWVALDKAIKLASVVDPGADIENWRAEQRTILDSILKNGFDPEVGAFMQSYGSKVLDAAVLRLPLQGVIDVKDPRMLSTIQQIERRLFRDGLVYRFDSAEDFTREAAFTSCTLWLISNYILLGRIEEAREVLQRVLSFQNPLRLFSEEIEPHTRQQLGNFPQTLTHVGLISAVAHLEGKQRDNSSQIAPRR